MAQYKVTEKSFINGRLVQAGAVVEVNDDPKKGGMKPGSNLEKVGGSKPAPAKEEAGKGE